MTALEEITTDDFKNLDLGSRVIAEYYDDGFRAFGGEIDRKGRTKITILRFDLVGGRERRDLRVDGDAFYFAGCREPVKLRYMNEIELESFRRRKDRCRGSDTASEPATEAAGQDEDEESVPVLPAKEVAKRLISVMSAERPRGTIKLCEMAGLDLDSYAEMAKMIMRKLHEVGKVKKVKDEETGKIRWSL